jgi:hypothetical protein
LIVDARDEFQAVATEIQADLEQADLESRKSAEPRIWRVLRVDTPEHFSDAFEDLSVHSREAGEGVFDEPDLERLDSRELAEAWKATPCRPQ